VGSEAATDGQQVAAERGLSYCEANGSFPIVVAGIVTIGTGQYQ